MPGHYGKMKVKKKPTGMKKKYKGFSKLPEGVQRKINKPFARKIQILTVGEQRAKVMGKSKVASIFIKGKDTIRKGRKK